MSWQILILISLVLASISTILQKISLRDDKSDPIAFSIFFQAVIGLICGFVAYILKFSTSPLPKSLVVNLIFMIILYGLGNIFIFTALKKIEASKFIVIFSSRALFTTLASTSLLGEGLSLRQLLGSGFIILGIIIATLKSLKYKFQKADLIGLLAGLSFGLANTNDRFLLKSIDVYQFLFMAFMFPAIFVFLFNTNKLKKMRYFLGKMIFPKILLLCFIYSASALTFFAALQKASNSSQVVNINLTGVIFTVILSIIFLKERQNIIKKITGAILSFIGLILIG